MKSADHLYLLDHLGEQRTEKVVRLLEHYNCGLRLTRPRVSKRGDFRVRGKERQISLNRDANRFRFLITLVHELAHLKTYDEFKSKVRPHGEEWKNNHRLLLSSLGISAFFSHDPLLSQVYNNEVNNPKACSGVDLEMERILSRYDEGENEVFLEDLSPGEKFEFRSNQYAKLENRRSRVLCLNLRNKRKYTINKASRVKPI